MKKLFFCCTCLLLSFSVSAQNEVSEIEKFKPLPKNIEKIKGLQYTIYKGDTTSENFSEYNFNKKGNIIKWEHFPYHVKEERKYDSLDRIIEIDGLYGESFGNGIIKYEYPSNNQKIEIHDKMGYYKYIKSDFIFDSSNRVIKEIKYDSTFNLMDSIKLVYVANTSYSYDSDGNMIRKKTILMPSQEKIYDMQALYSKDMLIDKFEQLHENEFINQKSSIKPENYFPVLEGEFKGKPNSYSYGFMKEDKQYKIEYYYDRIDSSNTSEKRKYFTNHEPTKVETYFYKNNHLIRLEEYTIPTESKELELSFWIDYSYFFHSKN